MDNETTEADEQSLRTKESKHPVDYKRKYLGLKRIIKQLVFVCAFLFMIIVYRRH